MSYKNLVGPAVLGSVQVLDRRSHELAVRPKDIPTLAYPRKFDMTGLCRHPGGAWAGCSRRCVAAVAIMLAMLAMVALDCNAADDGKPTTPSIETDGKVPLYVREPWVHEH